MTPADLALKSKHTIPPGKNKVVKTEYLHLEYTWPSDPAAYTPVTAAYQDEPPEGSASGDTSYDPTYAAPEDNSYTPLLSGADGGETSFDWPNTDCPEYAVQVVYRKPSLGGVVLSVRALAVATLLKYYQVCFV